MKWLGQIQSEFGTFLFVLLQRNLHRQILDSQDTLSQILCINQSMDHENEKIWFAVYNDTIMHKHTTHPQWIDAETVQNLMVSLAQLS